MTTEEFVRNFYIERKRMITSAFDFEAEYRSYVSIKIEELNLDEEETERFRHIISTMMTDTFYTILMGLDGAARIGEKQETFKIYSEDETLISDCGELESEAYLYFCENKLELEDSNCDFLAELNYLPDTEGGRKTAARTGYRPTIKFGFSEIQTSAQQSFIERELVFPSDMVNAEIKLASVEHLKNRLSEGTKFIFLEGNVKIGSGRILEILNSELRN